MFPLQFRTVTESPMESDALTTLASGISAQAPHLCQAGLSVLMALRLGALAVGAKTLWRDEIGDLACNSTGERCLLACFDAAFPISPFNLYSLQMASVLTHSLACFCLFRPPDSQGKGSWWQAHLRSKSQQLHLHLVNILARILLEGIFVVVFHSLYRSYPQTLYCMPSNFCPTALLCIVGKSNWKEAFNLFVFGTSWVSVMLCFIALYPALIKILQCPSRSTKTQLSYPHLAQSA